MKTQPTQPVARTIKLDAAGKNYLPLLDGPPGTHTMKSGLVILAPKKSVGRHTTAKNEEMLVVLAGQGEMRIPSGATLKLKKNMVAYCPPLTEHDVFNTGANPFRYVYIVAKAI